MTEWTPLDTEETIYTATCDFAAGTSRTVLVPLREGAVLVFSPGLGLASSASELIGEGVQVFLLAPSAAHTLGLAQWQARYPDAQVVAAPTAKPRIQQHTAANTAVADLAALDAWMPPHVSVHTPPVRRLGEVWLSIERDARVYWVVCDAFINAGALSGSWLVRWLKRLYRVGPGLEMTRLFVWNIPDRAAFRAWVAACFSHGAADALVPCHGDIDTSTDIGERVVALVGRRCR